VSHLVQVEIAGLVIVALTEGALNFSETLFLRRVNIQHKRAAYNDGDIARREGATVVLEKSLKR
jgi:hypothetical protein